MTETQRRRYQKIDQMVKRAKTERVIPSLPPNTSDEEIVKWLTKYDLDERLAARVSEIVEDRSDIDRLLQEALFQKNTTPLSVRVPPAMKAALSKLARQRTTDAATLVRIWIAERLQQELKAHH
jgi:hypothetical protein